MTHYQSTQTRVFFVVNIFLYISFPLNAGRLTLHDMSAHQNGLQPPPRLVNKVLNQLESIGSF